MGTPAIIEQLEAENRRLRAQLAQHEARDNGVTWPWLDQVNDAIFVAGPTWRIEQWNHAAEAIYGWERVEAIGQPIWDVIPVVRYFGGASDASAMQALVQQGVWRGTFVQRSRDGRELVIEGSTRTICDQNGAIGGYVGINRDISASHQAEHDLRASEERLRTILDNCAEGVMLISADLQVFFLSPAVTAILGYSPDELRRLGPSDITHPDDLPAATQLIREVMATPDKPGHATLRARHCDGSWRWIEQRAINQLGNPAVGAIIVSLHDVTGRVQAEQALQRTADRLATLRALDRATLEAHVPATIAHTILARVQALLSCQHADVILFDQNRVIQRLYTDSPALVAALPIGTQLLPNEHEAWQPMQIGLPWRDDNVTPLSYRKPLADLLAAEQIGSLLSVPLFVQWQLVGTLNLASTVPGAFTDEHAAIAQEIGNTLALALHNAQLVESLQQELAARERAELALIAEHTRVVQLKNEFMATMSHELRTPLAAVLGHTELLLEQIYGPLTPRQLTALERITRSGQSLLTLINDILDYTKLEAGAIALSPGPLDLPSLCHDTLQLLGEPARAKQISLSLRLDPAVTRLVADAQRLQQILTNLLANAVKFSHVGGAVELAVQGDRQHEQVCFEVRDQGIGIAEADLGRLFQPFTQLDSRLSRQYEGTGLGLALVRRLAEAHGGSVGVASELGQGSTFWVRLPWAAGAAARQAGEVAEAEAREAREAAPIAREAGKPAQVLLVEDHASNVAVIRDMLGVRGYGLVVAQEGGEALRLVSEERVDLVLMDIQLPGMSGVEVIRRMRAEVELSTVPIVALTALVMPGDRERCLAAGADEYLSKPVSAETLLVTIDRLLADRRSQA